MAIDYFKTVKRWDFMEALYMLLGLYFIDNHLIWWLVNSHLTDLECGTHQEDYKRIIRLVGPELD